MKKLLALLLALLLCVTLLVACGNDEEDDDYSGLYPPSGSGNGSTLPPLADGNDNYGSDIEWGLL